MCINSSATCGSVSMKVNIISKEQNPLMKRKEVKFTIDHSENGGTPSRVEVSRYLASILNSKSELIFVKNLTTKTGTMTAFGEATIYDKLEQAKLMEPKHIVARNTIPVKSEESKDEKVEG
jgi:ribosomal protein S24E